MGSEWDDLIRSCSAAMFENIALQEPWDSYKQRWAMIYLHKSRVGSSSITFVHSLILCAYYAGLWRFCRTTSVCTPSPSTSSSSALWAHTRSPNTRLRSSTAETAAASSSSSHSSSSLRSTTTSTCPVHMIIKTCSSCFAMIMPKWPTLHHTTKPGLPRG